MIFILTDNEEWAPCATQLWIGPSAINTNLSQQDQWRKKDLGKKIDLSLKNVVILIKTGCPGKMVSPFENVVKEWQPPRQQLTTQRHILVCTMQIFFRLNNLIVYEYFSIINQHFCIIIKMQRDNLGQEIVIISYWHMSEVEWQISGQYSVMFCTV